MIGLIGGDDDANGASALPSEIEWVYVSRILKFSLLVPFPFLVRVVRIKAIGFEETLRITLHQPN